MVKILKILSMPCGQVDPFGSSEKLEYKVYKEVHLPTEDLQECFFPL